MKRPRAKDSPNRQTYTGEIRRDLSDEQLALVGAVAMAYNEVEKRIDFLFFIATDLKGELQYEVSTRISGIDGKIAVIKKGATQARLSETEQGQLAEALGEGVFGRLKGYRDAVIHARITDGATGLGVFIGKRARLFDVLLSKAALERLFEHLDALRTELEWAANVLGLAMGENNPHYSTQDKRSFSNARSTWSLRFQARRTCRQALAPIPEFPSESELDAAASMWHQIRRAEMMEQSALVATAAALSNLPSPSATKSSGE